MSRRQSRTSLADRQEDTLKEFESLKRKYLQYNRVIIKENSQLRVQAEELKAQLSQLFAENLELGRANIALQKELSQERAANKRRGNGKAAQQADAAALSVIKELESLRQAIGQMNAPPSPSPPRPPKEPMARTRPDPAGRVALISKAPDFDFIQEGDSEDETEHVKTDPCYIPLPEDNDHPRVPSPSSPLANATASSSTGPTRRKPTRRQSGLLGPTKVRAMSPEGEPSVQDEDEVNEMLADDAASVVSVGSKPNSRRASVTDDGAKPKKKGKEAPAPVVHKLKDVTNSPPRNDESAINRKGIMSVLAENVHDDIRAAPPAKHLSKPERPAKAKHIPPAPVVPPPNPPEEEHDVDMTPQPRRMEVAAEEESEAGAGRRASRNRKSVNYAEPKLNTKMRKPSDAVPVEYSHPTLPSVEPTGRLVNPSQPSSAASTPAARPIKSLVLPSSLTKGSKKTPPTVPKASVIDEPRPPASGSSLSRSQGGPRAKTGPFRVRSPSPHSAAERRGGDEDGGQSQEDMKSESDSDEEMLGSDEAGSDAEATPRKSPRRSTTKVIDEIKCASLSSTLPLPKTSRVVGSSLGKPTNITKPVPSSSAVSTSGSSFAFPQKPFVPTSSSTAASSSLPATSSSNASAVNLKKRKAPPTKYAYMDLSDDDDEPATADQEEEYIPKDRRKTISTAAVGEAGPSKPRVDPAASSRRLSSAT